MIEMKKCKKLDSDFHYLPIAVDFKIVGKIYIFFWSIWIILKPNIGGKV